MAEKLSGRPDVVVLDNVRFISQAILVSGRIKPKNTKDAVVMQLSLCKDCPIHTQGCDGIETIDEPASFHVAVPVVNVKAELEDDNPDQHTLIVKAKGMAASEIGTGLCRAVRRNW